MARTLKHTGPYEDSAQTAIQAALKEVNIDTGDFLQCEYGNESFVFVPIDTEGQWEIHCDLFFSTTREQWKCKLTRVPHVRDEVEQDDR